jgi:hypothetical protein
MSESLQLNKQVLIIFGHERFEAYQISTKFLKVF